MISIRKSQVPRYLRKSEFYKALNEDDDSPLTIPEANFKRTDEVNSVQDATHLLSTLQFWGEATVQRPLIVYCALREDPRLVDALAPFELVFPYIPALIRLQKTPAGSKMITAIETGVVEVVECLIEADLSVPAFACNVAAEHGHLACLKYLHEQRNLKCSIAAAVSAAYHGKLDCLQYILNLGFKDSQVCVAAAISSRIECLRYAHEHGCKLTKRAMIAALDNGNTECFIYCHQNGCDLEPTVLRSCAEYDTMEIFVYAHQHHCHVDRTVPMYCARYGRLNMLKYCYEHAIPWDETTTKEAAEHGHLECLQFAHEHGCPWDATTTTAAAEQGHLEVLQYAVEHGCPYDVDTLLSTAAGIGVTLYVKELSKNRK